MSYRPFGSSLGGRGGRNSTPRVPHPVQPADDVANDQQRMLVVFGDVVHHARTARMRVGAAQFLGGDDLAGGRLHQRRSCQEDGPLVLDDHGLIGHRGHIGAAGGAASHDAGDLGDALGRHLRLVVEDPAEMLLVGKNLGLKRQIRAAGIDQIDAGQARSPGRWSAPGCAFSPSAGSRRRPSPSNRSRRSSPRVPTPGRCPR